MKEIEKIVMKTNINIKNDLHEELNKAIKNKLQINLLIKITLMIDMSLVTNGKIDQEMMIIIIINEKKHTTIDVMTNLLLKIKKDMIIKNILEMRNIDMTKVEVDQMNEDDQVVIETYLNQVNFLHVHQRSLKN